MENMIRPISTSVKSGLRYPWDLLPQVAMAIEHHQRDKAHEGLGKLLEIARQQGSGDLSLWKLRCSQIGSACIRAAQRGGAASDGLMEEHLHILKKLVGLRSGNGIRVFMHRYIDQLLKRVRPAQTTDMARAVKHVREKMRGSMDSSLTLAQHADALGVSRGHLSRSFASIAGHPFRCELKKIRMEMACRLLKTSRLKIAIISQRLGLRDPSQFVEDFRKHVGVTPGKYRKFHYGNTLEAMALGKLKNIPGAAR